MAKTTDFLSQTSGKLTDQFVTRQTAHGTILARAPKKTANARRSERQANMRCQLANMSANFKLYQGKLKLAWEGKKAGLSEYNCFVASNYDKNPVYITKSMRVAGACVLAESIISSGSLVPIENTVNGSGFMVSDLKLGGLVIDAETTVADLTLAILQNNAEWEDGDQLTWFYGVQRVDSAGTPRATLTAEKVVLDTTNENALWSVVSAVGFSSVAAGGGSGYVLGMGQALVNAGGVWVHSREKDSGSIKVSSQQMTVVSDVLAQYQTYAAMKASADSYGGINVSVAYLKPETLASISGQTSQGSGTSGGGTSSGGSGSETPSGGGRGHLCRLPGESCPFGPLQRGCPNPQLRLHDLGYALVPFFCFSFLKTRYARISDQRSSVEKEQKVMSFSLAPRKELKETSTLTKP